MCNKGGPSRSHASATFGLAPSTLSTSKDTLASQDSELGGSTSAARRALLVNEDPQLTPDLFMCTILAEIITK